MKTYKIGNQITNCIIRAYQPGFIGTQEMKYAQEPYTVLKDVSLELEFSERESQNFGVGRVLNYNTSFLNEINISNITITDKILNLIYLKTEALLCSSVKNFNSNARKQIFLPTDEWQKVFVYNNDGELESYYENLNEIGNCLSVEKANSSYLICYSFLGKHGVTFDRTNSLYLSLDLELQGNKEDETNTSWIHIEKAALKPTKDLIFVNNGLNSVDLRFKVINDNNQIDSNNNYLILE